jgi:hypothetical protein
VTRILQNPPVSVDCRVGPKSWALAPGNNQVAVVCAEGDGDPSYHVLDSVELYKYSRYAPGGSKIGVLEYAYSLLEGVRWTFKVWRFCRLRRFHDWLRRLRASRPKSN